MAAFGLAIAVTGLFVGYGFAASSGFDGPS